MNVVFLNLVSDAIKIVVVYGAASSLCNQSSVITCNQIHGKLLMNAVDPSGGAFIGV